jgi:LTR polyprotein gag-polypeptide-like protein
MIGYITGEIRCPDMHIDLRGANNWAYNDQIMQQTIRNNVGHNQKIHCTGAAMVQEMWRNLEAIYQSQGVQTQHQLMQELYDTKARKGNDIIAHLEWLKCIWSRITLICQDHMLMMSEHFKEYIVYLLPSTWITFVMLYIQEGVHAKKSVQSLIGKCNKEYQRQKRKEKMESIARENTYLAKASTSKTEPATVSGRKKKCEKCAICGYKNHKTADCWLKDKPKCKYCKKYNHTADACRKLKWDKKKQSEAQNTKKGKAKMVALALAEDAKTEKVKVNNAEIDKEALNAVGKITFPSINEGNDLINYDNDVQMANDNDNIDRIYDWLANSRSTLHITNKKNLYSEYNPILHTV